MKYHYNTIAICMTVAVAALCYGCGKKSSTTKTPDTSEFKVFYCCYSTGAEIPSAKAKRFPANEIADMPEGILKAPKDFFGVVDRFETTLQFYVEEDGRILVEIPYPVKKGSYGKVIEKDQVPSLLTNLPEKFTEEMVPGGKFQKW